MPAKKIRDLAVKTGSYTDRDGNTKGRYKNVGSLMESDDGSKFILLDTTFNPAGVPNPDNRDNVLISIFELREEGGGQRQQSAPVQRQAPQQPPSVANFDDDDIPF